MIRFTRLQLAATMVLAASAGLTLTLAGEAPATATANVPDAPPREYVIPKKGIPDAIRKAVESPDRPKSDTVRDGYRRPAEILALTGVKAGNKVFEFASMGQYYSRLLAEVVGPKGKLYMTDAHDYLSDAKVMEEQIAKPGLAFAAAHPNTTYAVVDYNKIDMPRGLDMVFNVLYYHELLRHNVDVTVLHDKIFKALRPGGIYMIIDHAGKIGVDMKDTLPLHRLDPSVIRQAVTSFGFELVVESRLLENLSDDHTWPIFAAGKRDQTDQVVYMFRKPIVY